MNDSVGERRVSLFLFGPTGVSKGSREVAGRMFSCLLPGCLTLILN